MKPTWLACVATLLLAGVASESRGQANDGLRDGEEAQGFDEPVVTERLAYPYSIDLLPDDPAPSAFTEAPDEDGMPSEADGFGRKTVTGDLFDRWLSTKECGHHLRRP